VVKHEKSPIGAAIASAVWGGLGQTYNGQLGKGIGLWIGLIISYALLMTGGEFFVIFALIIWVYGIYDAYTTSTKMNAGQIPFAETNIGHIIVFIVGSLMLAFICGAIIAAANYSSYYY
jgi:hypothetical protein